MKLSELIEIEGLESISEKTNISIYNLNSLANEDFSELNRVKALGFLQILEREYETKMEGLESKIREHFEVHTPVDTEPTLVPPDKAKESSGISKWIFITLLLGGIWYLYNSGKLNELIDTKEDTNSSILSDNDILLSKNSISEDEVKKSIIIKKEENGTKVEINTTKVATTLIGDSNDSNITLDKNGSKIKVIAEIPKDKSSRDQNQTIIVSSEAGVEEPTINTPTPDSNATEITNITINPTRGMLWYGFINIETRKHKEFMRKESTPFDLKGGKWILTTGHGYLDIVSDVKTLEVADRKRHYFYIDSKEIKEITRKEFRRLNHGRIW